MAESNFHPELKNIQQEFQQRVKDIEGELTAEREKEILKQVISEKFKATPQANQTSDIGNQTADPETNKIAATNAKQQYQPLVDSLINTVFEKGLSKAVEEVRNTRNAFLIDAFHDELVDKFYAEIKSKENG